MTRSELTVGILHPGQMGVSTAACVKNRGYRVFSASEGRGAQTRRRAAPAGLVDAGDLLRLGNTCPVLLSVCPPNAASALTENVLRLGFDGVYLHPKAISPDRVRRIGRVMADVEVDFVDRGIIGGRAWEQGTTA